MAQQSTFSNADFKRYASSEASPRNRRRLLRWLKRLSPLITFAGLITIWQLIVMLGVYPRFIVPAPAEVWETFVSVVSSGRLWTHAQVTLAEIALGLPIGVSIGVLLGYMIAKSPLLEDLLSPVIVAFQSTPIVAYAPLLIIWFGSGMTSKVITCAVIVFFPALMNTVVGIRNVPENLRDLMRSMKATPWQMFTQLEVPAALPVLLTGLKTSATLAMIGAVVGEFVSASEGLGVLIRLARSEYNTPLVLVTVFTMTAIALSLYIVVSLLEKRFLKWQQRSPVA